MNPSSCLYREEFSDLPDEENVITHGKETAEVRCFMAKLNSLDYGALTVFWRLRQFPRKIGLFVLTHSFQKQMTRQGQHKFGAGVFRRFSCCAFFCLSWKFSICIYPLSGRRKKSWSPSNSYDIRQWVGVVLGMHSSLLRLFHVFKGPWNLKIATLKAAEPLFLVTA